MPLVKDDRRLPKPGGIARLWESLRPYLAATVIIGIASAVAPVLQRLPHANNSLLFLTGVLITAVRYGTWPSVYASLLSFVIYNLLLTPPYFTFDVGEEGDLATLVFFLLMASITGNLAARMREASHKQELALRHIAALQDFTRSAAAAASCADLLKALTRQLAGHFGADCIVEVTGGCRQRGSGGHGRCKDRRRQGCHRHDAATDAVGPLVSLADPAEPRHGRLCSG